MTSLYRCAPFVALTVFLSLGCNAKDGKPGANPATPDAGKKTADQKADFSTSATQLAKDFLGDEKAATDKYTGKVIEIEGIVHTANPIIGKPGMFILEGAKKNEKDILGLNVYCSCPAGQENKVAMLSKGQKVKAKGSMQGANSLAVYLGDCSYAEVTPPSHLVVTAKQLTEDFSKDKDAASKKYQEKEVVVEGEVASLVEKNGFFSAKLAGVKSPLVVSCTLRQEEFNTLKKGQTITVKGDCSLFSDNEVTVNTAFLVKKDK